MVSEDFLSQLAPSDQTWLNAQAIAKTHLRVPTSTWQLLRLSWTGSMNSREFIRALGFANLNLTCLLQASELLKEGTDLTAQLVERALHNLGMRLCAVILGVNFVCGATLKRNPPPLWKKLFQETMSWVEIGYKFGAKAAMIGIEGGALLGFSKHAGELVLLGADPQLYRKWINQQKPAGKAAIDIFGCEPYQVSAFVLQQLGFGVDLSTGVALAGGALKAKHIQIDERANVWRAALLWIEALREGRGYPALPEVRRVFPELVPPEPNQPKNPILEVLYTEVSKVKNDGSSWIWHLPKPGYDDTEQFLAEKKSKKQSS